MEKSTETEEKTAISQETEENVAISQETEKKSSQELAETEEMKTIAYEKADDEKTEKKEVNSEKTEEKTLSPEKAAKMAEKRKIIDKLKAPMEESRPEKAAKTEETEKNQKTAQVIAKGKAPMAEEEQLFEVNVECRDDDFDDFKDLYEEFLAEPNSESDSDEFNTAVGWSLAEDFFQKIGASNVYWNFRKALDSGNIEALSHDELGPHRPFAGILMIFGVHYHKKERKKEVVLTILKEFMIGNGSKCDVIDFVNKYNVGEIHQAALQRAMFLVMCIHEEAGKVDEPANLVAEAFLDAYDTGIWGDEVFGTIYRFMRSPYKTLVVVGLVLATSLALVCKDRNSPELSKVIHLNKFAEVVHKMDTAKLEGEDEEVVMRVTAFINAIRWRLAEDFFQKIGGINWQLSGIFTKLETQEKNLCWCYAITDCLQAIFFQQWLNKIRLSKQEILDKVNPYATLGETYPWNTYEALGWIEKNGVSLEENYPHIGVKCVPLQRLEKPIMRISGLQLLPNDEEVILKRLEKNPVICSIIVNSRDLNRSVRTGKPYALRGYGEGLNHAVVLSGWADKPSACYLVRDPNNGILKMIKRGKFEIGERNPISYCCCVTNVFLENVK